MDRRPLPEHRLEVCRRQLACVEGAETLLDGQRAGERLLDRDLLVEREADQQRESGSRAIRALASSESVKWSVSGCGMPTFSTVGGEIAVVLPRSRYAIPGQDS